MTILANVLIIILIIILAIAGIFVYKSSLRKEKELTEEEQEKILKKSYIQGYVTEMERQEA